MKTLSLTALSLTILLTGCQSQGVKTPYQNQGIKIPYKKNVSLEVGGSEVIHGYRGKCGQSPPAWEVISPKLPVVSLGTFSDGGIGFRGSRSCGGHTPARAIRFTATQPGAENIKLFGDPVSFEVK